MKKCHIRLLFSTVALGMGAGLKHVKMVIHAGSPTSLESIFVYTFNITLEKFTFSLDLYLCNSGVQLKFIGKLKLLSQTVSRIMHCV
jgi:hypothetical protein